MKVGKKKKKKTKNCSREKCLDLMVYVILPKLLFKYMEIIFNVLSSLGYRNE